MVEKTMPATEADEAIVHDDERNSYEFAFHILPTVAEGEVLGVLESLKAHITKAGGEIFDEEAPERLELAYDIVIGAEGKNRSFHSAYFGWIRFRISGAEVPELTEEIEDDTNILRYLIIKLTKAEEAHPIRFHEARKEAKVVDIEENEVRTEAKTDEKDDAASGTDLDESLERITTDDAEEASDSTADTKEK